MNNIKLKYIFITLSELVGYIHDLGKSFLHFQNKILLNKPSSDAIRHEKISYNIICHVLLKLAEEGYCLKSSNLKESVIRFKEELLNFDINEFEKIDSFTRSDDFLIEVNEEPLHPIFESILQLTVSHHRIDKNFADFNDKSKSTYVNDTSKSNTTFKNYKEQDFILHNKNISSRIESCLNSLSDVVNDKDALSLIDDGENFAIVTQYILRPSFILADQNFSSKDLSFTGKQDKLPHSKVQYANSNGNDANQTLEEHLLGVAKTARNTSRFIFDTIYGKQNLYTTSASKELLSRTPLKFRVNYGWQDKAIESIENSEIPSYLKEDKDFGFLGFVSAETGAGKTRANAKIINAISNKDELRFSCFLGMKTLTLQTSDEYIDELKLHDTVSIIGSNETKRLHDKNRDLSNGQEASIEEGSLELKGKFKKDDSVVFPEFLQFSNREAKLNKIVQTPILVATIDYMTSSINALRSNKTKNLLRLMTSDVIIDEIDSYSPIQLITILKMVYLSGFYGRKVIVSSATISRDLIIKIKESYENGYKGYCKNKGIESNIFSGIYTNNSLINITSKSDELDIQKTISDYKEFLKKTKKRKIGVIDISRYSYNNKEAFYKLLLNSAYDACDNNYTEIDDISISTGFIEFANIKDLLLFSNFLLREHNDFNEDFLLKIETYHSRNFELKKSFQESKLMKLVKRKNENEFKDNELTQSLIKEAKSKNKKKVLVLVVASPIIETGRDFDFDFAIVEPRSHRSLVQAAGRVLRHRAIHPIEPNFLIMSHSLKTLREYDVKTLYSYPGFETDEFKLEENERSSSFYDLFEFNDGDYINSSVIVDNEVNSIVKKIELESFNHTILDIENWGGHDRESIYTGKHFIKFRESQLMKESALTSLNEMEADIRFISTDSDVEAITPISFDVNKFKNQGLILLQDSIEEICEFYELNYMDYLQSRKLVIQHYSKNTNDLFSQYIGIY